MKTSETLDHLWSRGCNFLGVRHAIMGGAMTWVSNHQLVAAISNADGFGVLACGGMSPELLSAEIEKTKQHTQKPFGVNLITMHPAIADLVEVCGRHHISHVVLAGGLPSGTTITRLKELGCKVIGFAPALILAKKLERMGVDALIIEGNEAGGHIGPVSTSVLAQEILPHMMHLPVFVAGGIGRGDMIVAYLKMGAAGCQLGTRFVCAHESPAHARFKEAFIYAQARDAVVTAQIDPRFPVIPVRALSNEATRTFMNFQAEMIVRHQKGEIALKDAQLEIEHYWVGALRRAVVDGDVKNGSIMAGQSVGMVKICQSTQEIMCELVSQAHTFLTHSF